MKALLEFINWFVGAYVVIVLMLFVCMIGSITIAFFALTLDLTYGDMWLHITCMSLIVAFIRSIIKYKSQ